MPATPRSHRRRAWCVGVRRAAVVGLVHVCVPGGCDRPTSTSVAPTAAASHTGCPTGTAAAGAAPPRGLASWCVDEGGRRHGPAREWFDDGSRRTEGEYRHGRMHGVWRSFYVGGVLRSERDYRDGVPVGTWTTYFADGTPATRVTHRGDTAHVIEFATGQVKLREGTLVGGERHGVWTEWDPAGVAQTSEWIRGVPTSGPGPGFEKIGIAECDVYFERYSRCVEEHVPAAQREAIREALRQTHRAWFAAAESPGKDALAQACKTAMEAAESATTGMGCTW